MISAWELECVADCRRLAEREAATIGGLHAIGCCREDVVNELLVQVTIACRHWAAKHVDKPPTGYLVRAMQRRKYRIFDQIRKALESGAGVDCDPLPPVVDDNQLSRPDWEAHARRTPVSDLLAETLTPAENALLQMRIEGWTNGEIAELLSIVGDDNQKPADVVKKRHYWVRKKARDFLKACGIETVEGALTAPPEVLDAAWKRARRRKI